MTDNNEQPQFNSSETFEIREESTHNFRTEIPNIVFSIGLSPSAFLLYASLKKIAGDNGKCFASNATLAEFTGLSDKTIREAKKSLELPQPLLGNKPLIKRTSGMRDSKAQSPDIISITDIWEDNFQNCFTVGKNYRGGRQNLPRGSVKFTEKEDPLKKNHPKKDDDRGRAQEKEDFRKDDLYSLWSNAGKDWTSPEIEEAWDRHEKSGEPISKPLAYFDKIIYNLRNRKPLQERKECKKPKKKKSKPSSPSTMDLDTPSPRLQKLDLEIKKKLYSMRTCPALGIF